MRLAGWWVGDVRPISITPKPRMTGQFGPTLMSSLLSHCEPRRGQKDARLSIYSASTRRRETTCQLRRSVTHAGVFRTTYRHNDRGQRHVVGGRPLRNVHVSSERSSRGDAHKKPERAQHHSLHRVPPHVRHTARDRPRRRRCPGLRLAGGGLARRARRARADGDVALYVRTRRRRRTRDRDRASARAARRPPRRRPPGGLKKIAHHSIYIHEWWPAPDGGAAGG